MGDPQSLKKCSNHECKNTYPDHKWGAIKAQRDGWFFEKSGSAWCPEHIPDWVDNWRKNNRRK